jgi:hypothetical protein
MELSMFFFFSTALAFDGDTLLERVAQTRSLRTHRTSEAVPTISDKDYRAAAEGKVATGITRVEGHSARIGYGVGVLDVPIDDLWAALNDETRHGDLTPLAHVELVAGTACADRRKVLMVLPLPMLTDRYWVNENRFSTELAAKSGGEVRELTWASVPDPASESMSEAGRAASDGLVPIGFNKGSWLLVKLDDTHTLAEFSSWVDPGGSIPTGPASMFATSGIEDTFESMRTYAKRGALPCKEG